MGDLVSVIIPTYNYGHYLGDCVDSILSQTHERTQIIVVDDGSTDDTQKKLDQYGSRVHYIYQQNQGLSAARNTGLAAVTGDFVQLLDADDMLHPRAIEYRLKVLKETRGCSWVVGQNYYFVTSPRFLLPSLFRSRWGIHSLDLEARLFQSNIAPPHAFLSRKELFDRVGNFDTSLRACEDYDYWMRALEKGYSPVYSSRGFVYYRQHTDSMSKNQAQQWAHDVIMHHRITKMLQNPPFSEDSGDAVLNRLFAALGILKTLNRATNLDDDNVAGLLKLYENQLREVENTVCLARAGSGHIRLLCLLDRLRDEESRFAGRAGWQGSQRLYDLSRLMVDDSSFTEVVSEYWHHYLVNGDANFKMKLDYFRWLCKSRIRRGYP